MATKLWTSWPTDPNGEDTRNVLAEEYKDHGAWARHYSTVRMTLGTFFLGAAIGIIYLRWDKPESRTAGLAGIILGIGILLFLRFSWLTFNEMNQQRKIVEAYRTALLKSEHTLEPLPQFWKWDAAYLCLIFAFLFVAFELWWRLG
jgi:hypothetical protein